MRKKQKKTDRNTDVLHAIHKAYPEGIVTDDVVFDEDSYYDEIREEVRAALRAIGGVDFLYDRPPEGMSHWGEESDPEEDPPDWSEEPSSYDLLFLALRGEQFQFEGELEEEDMPEGADEPVMVTVPTTGRIGCAVGISIVAPFAVIRFTEMELTNSDSGTLPDVQVRVFNLDGSEVDIEEHYEELFLEEGIRALRDLREKICQALDEFGIRVLTDEELRTPVPELTPDPEEYMFERNDELTVEDALFFHTE